MGQGVANADARFDLIARLADNKYLLGRRYAEWCSSAPSLESSVAAAAMAQDELGHARALYPLLKTLKPTSGSEIEPETRPAFIAFSALDSMFTGWPEFIAVNLLLDTAVTEIFRAASDSSFAPLAGRSRKALLEEHAHWQHATGWTRRLARLDGQVRAEFETALNALWDETLMWFGPEGDDEPLAADGTLDTTPGGLRSRFLDLVAPVLAAERLSVPVRETKAGWRLTSALPWEQWNSETRRLATAPAGLGASGL